MKQMENKLLNITIACLALVIMWSSCTPKQQYEDSRLVAANELIERVVPGYSGQFVLELIESENGKDVFEILDKDGQICLRGNTPVAIASAFNWYLKYTCNTHVSWCGDQLDLPRKLPFPKEKVHKVIDGEFRSYFNYCTLNYSASWWDWERWQREIDFMAMNGINMPLSVIGLEGVWYNALMKFGFSDEEARAYLVGPAYLAWQWMTNIQSHGGPLPKSWIDQHIVLGQKIIERQIELGMKPIQQGFSGCVPREFIQKFPDAAILEERSWCGFKGTAQLDPLDSLFSKFGKVFLDEQKKLFGAHGHYASDPFHEGHPPNESAEYMNAVGSAIFDLINTFDSESKWVMQAWSIRKDIATAVPKGKLLVLDLNGRKWEDNDSFWGHDFVVGNLHNFGGRINMHGDLRLIASNQYRKAKQEAPNVKGSGLFMEAIEHSPVYYDLAFEMPFHSTGIDIQDWLRAYANRRYGKVSDEAHKAWQLLLDGPYCAGTNEVEKSSMICARPAVNVKKSGPNAGFKIPYQPTNLIKALEYLLSDVDNLKQSEGFRYDIVDLQRQIMSNLSQEIHKKAALAFQNKDLQAFDLHSSRFLNLLIDVNGLLETRTEFSFDRWVSEARSWGITPEEKQLYEYNATLLVTQWGADKIFDYSWREWSSLISGYYHPRWEKFYSMLKVHLQNGSEYKEDGLSMIHGRETLRANGFYAGLDDWEKEWISTEKDIKRKQPADEVETTLELFAKYKQLAHEYYTFESESME